ncbi:MAG: hypothetical protein WCK90_02695 [archaeon]
MVIKSRENIVGAWLFVVGIVLACVVGIVAGNRINSYVLGVLATLGLILGFFVAEKDVKTFLLASVSLVVVSYAGISGLILSAALSGINIGEVLSGVLGALLVLFVPATIIVVIKTVFSIAHS